MGNIETTMKFSRLNSISSIEDNHSFTFSDSFVFRSSHQRCSVKKGVLRNFAKFTGKHLCQNFFLNKAAGNFINKFINKFINNFINKSL